MAMRRLTLRDTIEPIDLHSPFCGVEPVETVEPDKGNGPVPSLQLELLPLFKEQISTETAKVVHHKVGQIQALANSIEEENQARRNTIAEKNDKIESLKNSQHKEINKFEENLAAIADKLVAARKFYDDDNLSKEISILEERKQQMENKAGDIYQEMMALQSSFEELRLGAENHNDFNDSGIDMDTKKSIRKPSKYSLFISEKFH
ncbi:hypothetical protein KP79_PYT20390 [Mizuhopecten yessoensis]|uniref:Uncharacterized protein n=1 Tax=Mizuhopecten yessoensis TaxID=6573 RepID=A0A210QEM8_MIZYE|nr:hypothetical protein KP79_PYT20390 [Mizuhopecten yessoensis]